MSAGNKRTLSKAMNDAERFRALFNECYLRWEIAGSVRRGKPEVSDVEHVVIARMGEVAGDGLFETSETVNLLWNRLDELVAAGTLAKHRYETVRGLQNRWGMIYRGVDFNGFNHEIFTATPENFGSTLLIRTGPAEYSKAFVERFLAGRLYRQQGGGLVHVKSGDIVPIPDEETYFRMNGLPFVSPENRH